jgi:hypothetical protein
VDGDDEDVFFFLVVSVAVTVLCAIGACLFFRLRLAALYAPAAAPGTTNINNEMPGERLLA